jgi:aryl-alcohol dehydrogenase-like predicted oxidoreductase
MITEVEKSLQRLDTEYIDIYWVHAWDFLTHVEEVMRGLDDLVSAGKINYIGISNAPAWVVSKANVLAECRGWSRFAGIQVEYNLAKRDIEADFLPMAEDLDLCVTCWSPLAGGLLTGKYGRQSSDLPADSKRSALYKNRITEQQYKVSEALADVAKQTGYTPAQAALAWLRQKNNRVVPVIGARKIEQLQDNLGCLNCVLSDENVDFLDSISSTPPFYPYDLLNSEDQRQRTYGGFYDKIDRRN